MKQPNLTGTFCEKVKGLQYSTIPDILLHIEGYTLYRQDRYDPAKSLHGYRRGGGICIYVLDKYVDYLTVLEDISTVTDDVEQLWLNLRCPNVKQKLIGCIYRPPKGNIDRGLSGIRSSLDNIFNFNSDVIIAGDFNINYNLRHTESYKQLKLLEQDFGLTQIIKNNTRITKSCATCIDLILTNINYLYQYGTLETTISDHETVYLIKKKIRNTPSFNYIDARSYQNYVKEEFQNDLINDNRWYDYYTSDDVDMKWKLFEDIISTYADHYCPIKKIRVRNDSPNWFTKELVEEIYHRDRLYKGAKLSQDTSDWDKYKKKKNEVKKLIFQAREEYIKGRLEEDRNDPKKFWRSINKLTGFGKSKKNVGLSEIIIEDGQKLMGQEAASYMNNLYTNAGPNLAKSFKDQWVEEDCTIRTQTTFSFGFISEDTVSKLISDIKIAKSSATGSLSSRILKDIFSVRFVELTDLYNLCLDSGTFPKEWGIGEITPIPKVNIHSKKPEEWRPITQIKLPEKILERCVHAQLYSYFDQNFLNSQQHGFRPLNSTSTAVFDMLKTSFKSWNDKLYQTCVFIHFSKAFDCIDHNILISKLKLYGLDAKAISFISSYFNNRYQRTHVDGNISEISKVTYGTAQGSIIGPLIFIIYVNDIFDILTDQNEIIMYADDTLLMSEGPTILESISRCQVKLDKLIAWCDANKLSVNIKKTKCMYINSSDESSDVRLYIRGKSIDVVKYFEPSKIDYK